MLEAEKDMFPKVKIMDSFVFKRAECRNAVKFVENTWKLCSRSAAMVDRAHSPPNKAKRGMKKTLHRLRQRFYWPRMVAQIRDFVMECQSCKEMKQLQYFPQSNATERVYQSVLNAIRAYLD